MHRFISAIATMSTVFLAIDAYSEEQKSAKSPLTGLPGIFVFTEPTVPELRTVGLFRGDVDSIVNEQLHTAKVPVHTIEQCKSIRGEPYIAVTIAVTKVDERFVIRVRLSLEEKASSLRDPDAIRFVSTWSTSRLSIATADQLKENTIHFLKNAVDELIAEYKDANMPVPESK